MGIPIIEDDEHCFRQACYEALGDDAPWLVYSDWLRENGRETMADRLPVLRKVLVSLLPVALPIALPIAELLD